MSHLKIIQTGTNVNRYRTSQKFFFSTAAVLVRNVIFGVFKIKWEQEQQESHTVCVNGSFLTLLLFFLEAVMVVSFLKREQERLRSETGSVKGLYLTPLLLFVGEEVT